MANQSAQSKYSGARGVVQEKLPSCNYKKRRLSVIGNATTPATAVGMAIPTGTGTATARNWANTNILTQCARLGYVTAGGGAGENASLHNGVANLWRGNFAGGGGFGVLLRFGVADAIGSTSVSFMGLANTASVIGATVEPSAVLDCVGCGKMSTSQNMCFTWNDASGTGTVIDLGTEFPACDTATLYTLEIFCDVNDPTRAIQMSLTNEANGAHKRIVIPGDHATVPTITTAMGYHIRRASNGLTAVVAVDIVDVEIFTPL
jgi:hypothetical protein